jgi:hypothetical protein
VRHLDVTPDTIQGPSSLEHKTTRLNITGMFRRPGPGGPQRQQVGGRIAPIGPSQGGAYPANRMMADGGHAGRVGRRFLVTLVDGSW